MRTAALARALCLALALGAIAPGTASAQCDRLPSCELVWSDEFDGNALDLTRWEPMLGDGTTVGLPAGWGNNELQYYQAENATVADGLLTITARRQSVAGYAYTSARLRTRGMGDWTYGRMEMRARMPVGQGLWPAFWMLPTDTSIYGRWAASGEIDIVEYLGSEPDRILGTLHYGNAWPRNAFSTNDYRLPGGASFHDAFHLFAIEWERHEIRWYVDGVHYATQTDWYSVAAPYPAPFDVDFHLLLNMAVGGNFPGPPDGSTRFPQELVVDWVRVYQSVFPAGTQTATSSQSLDVPARLKRIRATLTTTFENQALKRDGPADARTLACAVGAQGPGGTVRPKGRLEIRLAGTDAAGSWLSGIVRAPLDKRGEATVGARAIAALVDEAAGSGASVRRLRVTYLGRGAKKASRVTLDCVQWRDGAEPSRP